MTPRFTHIRKLLFIIPARQFGGAERHSLDLCCDFASSGVEVSVLSTRQCLANPAFTQPSLELIAKNIAWDDTQSAIDNALRQEVILDEVLIEAQAQGRRFDFAFVCAPWPHYACGAHARLAMRNIPHILISHLFPHDRWSPRYAWPIHIESLRRTASAGKYAWVGVSWPISRRIERLFRLAPNSVSTIENAVDVAPMTPQQRVFQRRAARTCLGLAANRKLVLVLGRLEMAKGTDLLPAIIENVADIDPLLVCAGEGRLMGAVSAAPATRRGLIKAIGYVAQPDDWILAADALLLPSRIEGHPLAFLEAAARRCPVVATDTALECYGERAAQIALVAPMDNVNALAAALRKALLDPTAQDLQVEVAYGIARARDRDAMFESYKRITRQVLAAHVTGVAPLSVEAQEKLT